MNSSAFSLLNTQSFPVIDPGISGDEYCRIDLSSDNPVLKDLDVSSSRDWQKYIDKYLTERKMKVAYGGYLENRAIYQRSSYFKESAEERSIHLGIDLWTKVGTSVHAAFDGTIHSFKHNTNHGDYGPTIILEHHFEKLTFHTLYGHLSLESLLHLKVGSKVKGGEQIGHLGDTDVNGDYAPHLHFQIIIDLGNYWGDYPGVCSKSNLDFFRTNCPDPALVNFIPLLTSK